MTICEYTDCRVSACFNVSGEQKGKFCKNHKLDGMINVVDKLCEKCNIKRAMCNYRGKTGGIYCAEHKLENMVNVKSKRCGYKGKEICYTAPIYNFDGQKTGKYCIQHMQDGMVNVTTPKCENTDCKCIAQFNFSGNSFGKYCSQHKENGMVDVKHKRCEYENCQYIPSYKFKHESSCRFCAKHKLDGMINGKHTMCNEENCNKSAGFNYIGQTILLYCGEHKKENMVDLKHQSCIESGCDKRPIYNYEGHKKGIYCVIHKKDEMIYVFAKQCVSTWCNNTIYEYNKKYDNYCMHCYIHLFPDKPVTRNYKTKEKNIVDTIMQSFANVSWIADKRVQDGCSRRRPDLFLDLGYQIIIIEIDENQHTEYDCSCENKRLMEISQDVGHRPIVFIRFNPDQYIDKNGIKIKSCWITNKLTGLLYIPKPKIDEWAFRVNALKLQIQYWIDNKTDKTVEIIQLFYDGHII